MERIWPRILFAFMLLNSQFYTFNYHKIRSHAVFAAATQSVPALVNSRSRLANNFPYVLFFLIPETQTQKYISISSPPVMSLGAPISSAAEAAALWKSAYYNIKELQDSDHYCQILGMKPNQDNYVSEHVTVMHTLWTLP